MINDLEDGEIESDDNNVEIKDSQNCNPLDKSSVYTNRNGCYDDNNVDIIKSCSLNDFTSNSVALHGAAHIDRHDHELFVSIINEKEMPKSNNSSQQVHDSNCYRNDKKTDDGELTNETDETDDEMMICVRGASPVARKNKRLKYDIPLQYHNYDSDNDYHEIRRRKYHKKCYDDNDNDYDSCDSYRKSLEKHFKRRRKHHRRYSRNRSKRITENSNTNNSIMKGDKPNSNDNENFNEKLNVRKVSNTETLSSSSKYNEDRKTEICKFYLTDCCIKSINCNYMHSDFPCKFYYLGMECMNKPKCKFMHGNALSEKMKTALLHHIIAAPKTILGNFKRLTYDEAESMLKKRDSELIFKTKNEINFDLKSEQQSIDKKDLNETDYSKDKIDNVTKIERISKSRWSPTLNDAENSISAEILKRFCSSKTDKVNCTKQEDTVLLKDSNLPSDIIENLAKHNITNLYQFSQLSLSLLEHLSSLKNKTNDDEEITESNNDKCDKEHEKNVTEPIENDDKHLLDDDDDDDDDEKENEQSENFELNSCISDESDENENLIIDESDIYNNEEPNQVDEVCRDWENDSTIKSSVEYKNEDSKFIEDEHYSDSDIIPGVIGKGDVRVSPFIAIQEFSPAVEIMASINSHSPIKYELKEIDICFKSNRKISLPTDTLSDEIADPRIKKMLNLKKLKCNDDKNENKINSIPDATANATTASTATVVSGSVVKKEIKELDPRKRKEIKSKDTTQKSHQQQPQLQPQQQQQKTTHLPKCEKPFDILTKYLQNSKWYQELNIVRRIYVNQQLVILGNALTEFHRRQSQFTDEKFSLNKIHNGNNIDEILNRLQIFIDPSGCIKEKYQNESQTTNDDIVLSSNDDDKQKIPSLLSLKFNESINSIVKNASNMNNTKNLFVQRATTTTALTPPNVHQQNVKRGLLGLAPGVPQQSFPLLAAGVGSTRGYQPPITYLVGNPYYSQSQSIRLQHPIAPPIAPPVNYHPRYHNLSHHFTH